MSILAMLTIAVVTDLRASRMSDELKTAVRVVSSDIRTAQTQAIAGQNLKTCVDTMGNRVIAENSSATCMTSIGYSIPSAVGLAMASGTTYDTFAEIDNQFVNGIEDPSEIFVNKQLAQFGTPNVTITIAVNGAPVNNVSLAFRRQSGTMLVDGALNATAPKIVTLTLTQTQSGQTKTITIDQWSGRILTSL